MVSKFKMEEKELKCRSVDLSCRDRIPCQEKWRKTPTPVGSTLRGMPRTGDTHQNCLRGHPVEQKMPLWEDGCSLQPRWSGKELQWPRWGHHCKNPCCPKHCYFCFCGVQVHLLPDCLLHFKVQEPQRRGLPPGYKCTLSWISWRVTDVCTILSKTQLWLTTTEHEKHFWEQIEIEWAEQ